MAFTDITSWATGQKVSSTKLNTMDDNSKDNHSGNTNAFIVRETWGPTVSDYNLAMWRTGVDFGRLDPSMVGTGDSHFHVAVNGSHAFSFSLGSGTEETILDGSSLNQDVSSLLNVNQVNYLDITGDGASATYGVPELRYYFWCPADVKYMTVYWRYSYKYTSSQFYQLINGLNIILHKLPNMT